MQRRRPEPFNPQRFSRYAKDLSKAVLQMTRIRITEPVFFLGENRKAGDVIDAAVGPYRTETIPGGLKRIPQFVEMPEEIKQTIVQAAQAQGMPLVAAPPPNTLTAAQAQAQAPSATPAPPPIPPAAPVKIAPKANPLAARIRALTTRRARFSDYAASLLDDGEKAMATMEGDGPAILERAVQSAQDELTAITDLGDSLKEMDRTNGNPL